MQTVPLTGSEVRLSVLGQGSWQISTRGPAAERALDALERGIALGMTHLDTAEMYGSGASEQLLARLWQERAVDRAQLVLASKVLPSNASRKGTIQACERSLRRLGCELLDLYMLHWPGHHPLQDTLRSLEELVQRGLVRAIGVSNFDVDELTRAQACLRNVPLAFNQVLYHLQERGIERRLLPYCAAQGITVVAYSPFGQGDFPAPDSPGGSVLAEVGQAHGRTPRQVALRFLTRQTGVVAIPKAERVAHVEENAGGCGFELSEAQIRAIDEAFPVRGGRGLAML